MMKMLMLACFMVLIAALDFAATSALILWGHP
jgi:hypothetical protein